MHFFHPWVLEVLKISNCQDINLVSISDVNSYYYFFLEDNMTLESGVGGMKEEELGAVGGEGVTTAECTEELYDIGVNHLLSYSCQVAKGMVRDDRNI